MYKRASQVLLASLLMTGLNAQAGLLSNTSCASQQLSQADNGSALASCSLSSNGIDAGWEGYGQSAAQASSRYGVLKAWASAAGQQAYASASALAGFTDAITISADGMAGKTGEVTFKFQYDWFGSFGDSDDSEAMITTTFSAFASGTATGAYQSLRSFQHNSDIGTMTLYATNSGQEVAYDAPILLTVPFHFGQAFNIDVSLFASANGGPPPGGSWDAMLDASHSAYWAGIVTLATSEPLNGAQLLITSASGTDFSRSFVPVSQDLPEPSAFGLLGLGLVASRLARGNRRRARRA
jgi:hypothetical protein